MTFERYTVERHIPEPAQLAFRVVDGYTQERIGFGMYRHDAEALADRLNHEEAA